jgi:cysteate synthase
MKYIKDLIFMKISRMLSCLSCGDIFQDDGLCNDDKKCASLLRAVYEEKSFKIRNDAPGIYRYADWLPIDKMLEGSAAPVSYWSKGLSKRLGLSNLLVTFSGYWAERGAFMKTGSFKECEAYSVCARLPEGIGSLVVASAGNTARAFIRAASENNIPLVIVIPEKNLSSLYAVSPVADCVRVTAVKDGDYFDAISLANKICERQGFINEGGARNVARRDGMGTTVLSAVETAGVIPDFYVQAIGSGTGAIAAHEANLRVNASGFCEARVMRLILAQNSPFVPIAEAWSRRSRELAPQDADEARRQIDMIDATVLSNRMPPYGITGGLFDALCAAGGEVQAVTNDDIRTAAALFQESEGCDICPEAGAALAALIKALECKLIGGDALVMLNITGGGMRNIARELNPRPVRADFSVPRDILDSEHDIDELCGRLG